MANDKMQQIHLRFSPLEDEDLIRWKDNQRNVSLSLKLLLRGFINENGYVDVQDKVYVVSSSAFSSMQNTDKYRDDVSKVQKPIIEQPKEESNDKLDKFLEQSMTMIEKEAKKDEFKDIDLKDPLAILSGSTVIPKDKESLSKILMSFD